MLATIFKFKNSIPLTRYICMNIEKNIENTTENVAPHIPVMVEESLNYLKLKDGETMLDMTFGAGGHSKKILEKFPNVRLICLDRDIIAYNYAKELSEKHPKVLPLLGKFSDLPELLNTHSIRQKSVDSILFDFGCSSMQFDEADRGFSVSKNGPLDMRMDGNRNPDSPTAADVLAKASEVDIYKIIKCYGEEKQARKIARAIIEARYLFKRLTTTQDLTDLVESVCSDEYRTDMLQRKTHVATKTFQALRIFVNNELNEINYGMILAQKYLKIGGRLVPQGHVYSLQEVPQEHSVFLTPPTLEGCVLHSVQLTTVYAQVIRHPMPTAPR